MWLYIVVTWRDVTWRDTHSSSHVVIWLMHYELSKQASILFLSQLKSLFGVNGTFLLRTYVLLAVPAKFCHLLTGKLNFKLNCFSHFWINYTAQLSKLVYFRCLWMLLVTVSSSDCSVHSDWKLWTQHSCIINNYWDECDASVKDDKGLSDHDVLLSFNYLLRPANLHVFHCMN